MSESINRICFYCKKEKIWMWHGDRLKDKTKIYLDDKNQRWSGKRCPDCERTRVLKALKCDDFKRQLILEQFKAQGFDVISDKLPFKVARDGIEYSVGFLHAATKDTKISVDEPMDEALDFYAVVFQSVRFCSKDQLRQWQPQLSVPKSFKQAPELNANRSHA